MKMNLKGRFARTAAIASSLALAAGVAVAQTTPTVPAVIQTSIDDSSQLGKVILLAVVGGLAIVGILSRALGKAGVK